MPHVFTLEGADLSTMPQIWSAEAESDLMQRLQRLPSMRTRPPGLGDATVWYPGPSMPHRALNVGPARPPTPVYDADELRQRHFRRTVWRRQIAVMRNGLGDATEFLRKQNPVVSAVLVLGASLATSLAVGSIAVYALRKAGARMGD